MFVIYFVNRLLTGVITYMGTVRHRGGVNEARGREGIDIFGVGGKAGCFRQKGLKGYFKIRIYAFYANCY